MTCFHFVFIPILWNPISPFLLSLLYASWCGTTWDAILDRRREEERHKTKTDKRRQKSSCDCCSTIKDSSFTMPAGVSAFSAENSLPLHTCFCIRHAWLVFMKYFASFLKNTTFIFKGHYQYMSMIIMKLSPLLCWLPCMMLRSPFITAPYAKKEAKIWHKECTLMHNAVKSSECFPILGWKSWKVLTVLLQWTLFRLV